MTFLLDRSSVVSLIERFYDPVSGVVTLDGVDIKTLNLPWYRQQIALVSQVSFPVQQWLHFVCNMFRLHFSSVALQLLLLHFSRLGVDARHLATKRCDAPVL
jgi:hypothetical protein